MKKVLLFCLVAGALALVGCATPHEPAKSLQTVDASYVQAVERQAGRIGTRVHWVNPPRRAARAQETPDS